MNEPWEYAFEREMQDQLGRRKADVLSGKLEYATYTALCGEIRGIQNCMDELKRIKRRLENPDGDVDLRSDEQ